MLCGGSARARSADVLAANSLDVRRGEGAGIPTGLVAGASDRDRVACVRSASGGALADRSARCSTAQVRRLRISRVGFRWGVWRSSTRAVERDLRRCRAVPQVGNAALRGSSTAVDNLAIAAVLPRRSPSRAARGLGHRRRRHLPGRRRRVHAAGGTGRLPDPQGGASLIVDRQRATVPFVIDGDGNCTSTSTPRTSTWPNHRAQRQDAASSVCTFGGVAGRPRPNAAQILPRLDTALADVELVVTPRPERWCGWVRPPTRLRPQFLDMRMSVTSSTPSTGDRHVTVTRPGTPGVVPLTSAPRAIPERSTPAVLLNASTRLWRRGSASARDRHLDQKLPAVRWACSTHRQECVVRRRPDQG